MFTATITALAAAAALNAQTVSAQTPAAANTVSKPAVTAVSLTARAPERPRVRIPGTFDVSADDNTLDGVQVLYLVRAGDGA